jgi:hypothetical protein
MTLIDAGKMAAAFCPQGSERVRKSLATPATTCRNLRRAKPCRGARQQKSRYGRTFIGIVRTTYLIGADGKVAKRWDNVKADGHADDVSAGGSRAIPKSSQLEDWRRPLYATSSEYRGVSN